MEVQKMLELADYLENLPAKEMFNMDYWISTYQHLDESGSVEYDGLGLYSVSDLPTEIVSCNTAGCIAGWAWLHFVNTDSDQQCECGDCFSCISRSRYYSIESFAAEYLGLDASDANKLFMPFDTNSIWVKYAKEFDYSYINPFGEIDDDSIVIAESINSKDAAYMLRALATGMFNFDPVGDVDLKYNVLEAAERRYHMMNNPEMINLSNFTED